MNIKSTLRVLPILHKSEVTPLLWGSSGIGKSSLVHQYGAQNGYKVFDLRLATNEPGDLLGLQVETKDLKTGEVLSTKHATPDWLKRLIDHCAANPEGGAVIFLDEINRAPRATLQAVFQLALDRRLHTTELPKNCFVVAAANRTGGNDNYMVTDIDDGAFLRRFCHIVVESNVADWLEFARTKKFSSRVVNFISAQPELLQERETIDPIPVKPAGRPWEFISRYIDNGMPDDLLYEVMQGTVGAEAASAFKAFEANQEKPLTADQLLKEKGAMKQLKTWAEDTRMDLVNASIESINFEFLKENALIEKYERLSGEALLTADGIKFMNKLFKVIPKESVMAFLASLKSMTLYRILGQLVKDNPELKAQGKELLSNKKGA